jgi:hypothetical protein
MSQKQKKIQKIIERKQESMNIMKANKSAKIQPPQKTMLPSATIKPNKPNTKNISTKPDKYDSKMNMDMLEAYRTVEPTAPDIDKKVKDLDDSFM